MRNQIKWRIVGGAAVVLCLAMTVYGANPEGLGLSLPGFITYWTVAFILFAIAIFLALLDLRYIRVQYAIWKRELFRQTFGDEKFRKALRADQQKVLGKDRRN